MALAVYKRWLSLFFIIIATLMLLYNMHGRKKNNSEPTQKSASDTNRRNKRRRERQLRQYLEACHWGTSFDVEISQSRALEQTLNKGTTSDAILFLTGVQLYPTSTRSLYNRPFLSCLLPLFQNESKCKTFHMKMSFTHKSIWMQIKLIFIWKVSHLDSVWNRGRRQLENGLFAVYWLSMNSLMF